MKQDFYKVTELTKEVSERIDGFDKWLHDDREKTVNESREYQLWLMAAQLQVQLAIAQQLTMVAQHLGSLVSMLKDEANKKP